MLLIFFLVDYIICMLGKYKLCTMTINNVKSHTFSGATLICGLQMHVVYHHKCRPHIVVEKNIDKLHYKYVS